MNVSDLVAQLEGFKAEHGDIRILENDEPITGLEYCAAIPEADVTEYANIQGGC